MAHICRSQIELDGARFPFDENTFVNVASQKNGPLTLEET